MKSLLVLGFIEITYYPFGMISRSVFTSSLGLGYRYGFNGKENDADVKGDGDQIDYGMRVYDPRIGKFLSVDPISKNYPALTPYQFASNRPIDGIDKDGLEWQAPIINQGIASALKNPKIKEVIQNVIEVYRNLFKTGPPRPPTLPKSEPVPVPLPLQYPTKNPSQNPKDDKENEDLPDYTKPTAPIPIAADKGDKYGEVSKPKSDPNGRLDPPSKPDADDDEDKYVTIFRGIGQGENMNYKDKVVYAYAKAKIAVPKGLIPDNSNQKVNENPELHTVGLNNSIYTSWTFSNTVAERFARGKNGNLNGIVLIKRIKKSELIETAAANEHYPEDFEVLLKGVQKADEKYDVKPVKKD